MLLEVGKCLPPYQIAPGSIWPLTVTNPLVADWRLYKFRCDVQDKETGEVIFTVTSDGDAFVVDGTDHQKVTMTFQAAQTTLLTPERIYLYDVYAFLESDMTQDIPFLLTSELHCVTRITNEDYDA